MPNSEPRSRLWRRDGVSRRRIDARLTADGALEITGHDIGSGDSGAWGEGDHEASLRVEAGDLAALVLALLTDGYAGRSDALQAVRSVCQAFDVPAKFSVWT